MTNTFRPTLNISLPSQGDFASLPRLRAFANADPSLLADEVNAWFLLIGITTPPVENYYSVEDIQYLPPITPNGDYYAIVRYTVYKRI